MCFEREIGGEREADASGAAQSTANGGSVGSRRASVSEPETFNPGAAGGRAGFKRALPVAAALDVLARIIFWLTRRSDEQSLAK